MRRVPIYNSEVARIMDEQDAEIARLHALLNARNEGDTAIWRDIAMRYEKALKAIAAEEVCWQGNVARKALGLPPEVRR